MYKRLLCTEDILEYFTYKIFNQIGESVAQIINNKKIKTKSNHITFQGSIRIDNANTLDNKHLNIWTEYDCKMSRRNMFCEFKFVDIKIKEFIIYDQIPDIVLDRFNELNKQKYLDKIKT